MALRIKSKVLPESYQDDTPLSYLLYSEQVQLCRALSPSLVTASL